MEHNHTHLHAQVAASRRAILIYRGLHIPCKGQLCGFEGVLELVASDLTTCYNGAPLIDTVNSCYPIYNGAKPEYPRSVFLGAFSVLRSETDEIPDAALWTTSICFGCDAKTATRIAPAEGIGEKPLR